MGSTLGIHTRHPVHDQVKSLGCPSSDSEAEMGKAGRLPGSFLGVGTAEGRTGAGPEGGQLFPHVLR